MSRQLFVILTKHYGVRGDLSFDLPHIGNGAFTCLWRGVALLLAKSSAQLAGPPIEGTSECDPPTAGLQESQSAFENRLDIDDRSAVDCLRTVHLKPAVPVYAQNRCAVQPYWVGPVRRTGCKHPHHRFLHITSRLHLENRALRFMEPRGNPDVLSRLDAVGALDKSWIDFQFRIGRALPSLQVERRSAPRVGNVPIGEISKLFGISITGPQNGSKPTLLRPAARTYDCSRPGLEASLDTWRGKFQS